MENTNNIALICRDCSDERTKEFQSKFNKYSLKVGDFIKTKFNNKKDNEHMWVQITSIVKDGIIGKLANEPIIMNNLCLGDKVKVKFKDIEDLQKNK